MGGAFEGVVVLDLGQIYNGPYCTLMLAQLGATVVKVEPLEGETLRSRARAGVDTHEFTMLNSSKASMAVDLKSAEGREVFLELVRRADVLVENFRLGTMARLGLGADRLLQENPRLVYATGKGYGLDGPYAHLPAMDLTVQAMSGVIASTGFPDGPPVKAGPALMDFLGGIHLFAGVASALYQRDRTGRGQVVEVAMHDAVYPTLASPLGAIYNDHVGDVPERTGNRHSGLALAPYNVYEAADGWIAVFCVTDRHFVALAGCMGQPELVDDPEMRTNRDRAAHMERVDAVVGDWLRGRGRWEAADELQRAGVPCAPVLRVAEVADDPHLRARGTIRDVEHPVRGTVPVPVTAIRMGDSPVEELRPAPLLGQHTDEVLRGLLGYGDDRVAGLRERGVVR